MSAGVYVVGSTKHGWYKIGRSARLLQRVAGVQFGIPFELDYKKLYPIIGSRVIERNLHHHFRRKNIRGEWFRLSSEDLEAIPTLFTFKEDTTFKAETSILLGMKARTSHRKKWREIQESKASFSA